MNVMNVIMSVTMIMDIAAIIPVISIAVISVLVFTAPITTSITTTLTTTTKAMADIIAGRIVVTGSYYRFLPCRRFRSLSSSITTGTERSAPAESHAPVRGRVPAQKSPGYALPPEVLNGLCLKPPGTLTIVRMPTRT